MEDLLVFKGSGSLRYRLALSCLSGRPICIEDIRLRDVESPGLQKYEASLLMLLDAISDGMDLKTLDNHIKVKMYPGLLVGAEGLVFNCGLDRGMAYFLEFLLMVGPFCKNGIDITLRGITDHPDDLSIEAIRAVTIGLAQKIDLPGVSITVKNRGMLPKGGGEVHFACEPLKLLKPFQITYAGRVKRVRGTTWTCHMAPLFARRCVDSARRILNELLPDVWVYTDLCSGQKAGNSHGFGICLVAETMKGCLYSADGLIDKSNYKKVESVKDFSTSQSSQRPIESILAAQAESEAESDSDASTREDEEGDVETGASHASAAEALGEKVACDLLAEIASSGVTDRAFQWLPILYMALADEYAPSRVSEIEIHIYTELQVVLGELAPTTIELLRHLDTFFSLKFSIEYFRDAAASIKKRIEDEEETVKGSVESEADIKGEIKDSQNESEDEEAEVEIEKDRKQIEKMRVHNSIIVTCVGIGLVNIARKTF
eukprot:Gregarina_sp_Pseudo_9__4784@NODE_4_length_7126_cov_97_921970_g3_i0_p2_GENE_NODE_4_length_7126_cov_97_921970_g3_i0NODE_4_length_7126_cov_97_921970_g3_i0_p2_ORF_typecomplete_len501_score21_26RTC/PF01137_21/2_4e73RTC/PF01137_21/8_1e03RTC_insert/PF05189_13/6_4e28NAMassociated/PF14303_6/0_064DUF724/PF05266_14/0_33Astro_capsid_p/PF12226_8/38Astro_capsid_p/PF12226_8/3_3_NODE_4_length_7126_cov_97_921970_g3_i0421505